MPQGKVRVLNQLCAKQAGKIKHLAYLCPGLDRARPFDPYEVDGLARADAQGVD